MTNSTTKRFAALIAAGALTGSAAFGLSILSSSSPASAGSVPASIAGGPGIGDDTPTGAQLQQDLDINASDLGAATARQVSDIARVFFIADSTGEGTDLFPGFWGDEGVDPCCDRVNVRAVGAYAVPNHPELARAVVAWDGVDAASGEALDLDSAYIYFIKGPGDTWNPLHDDDVPGDVEADTGDITDDPADVAQDQADDAAGL